MRKWIAVAIGLVMATTSCAATWTISGHAPTQDNTGTCGAPVLVPTVGGLVRVNLVWSGPNGGSNQVIVQPGAPFAFNLSGPSGQYRFVATATDSLGNADCHADTIDVLIRGSKFASITDLKAN